MDDKKYMQLALAEARKAAELGEIPIGAVLADMTTGEVIAAAHNMRETWHDATAHAEVIVIREACERLGRWRLSGCALYVTVEPCPMCSGAIVNGRVDRVVYGCPDVKAGGAESIFNIITNPNLNHCAEVVSGICEEECAQVMRDFFRRRRQENKAKRKSENKRAESCKVAYSDAYGARNGGHSAIEQELFEQFFAPAAKNGGKQIVEKPRHSDCQHTEHR